MNSRVDYHEHMASIFVLRLRAGLIPFLAFLMTALSSVTGQAATVSKWSIYEVQKGKLVRSWEWRSDESAAVFHFWQKGMKKAVRQTAAPNRGISASAVGVEFQNRISHLALSYNSKKPKACPNYVKFNNRYASAKICSPEFSNSRLVHQVLGEARQLTAKRPRVR